MILSSPGSVSATHGQREVCGGGVREVWVGRITFRFIAGLGRKNKHSPRLQLSKFIVQGMFFKFARILLIQVEAKSYKVIHPRVNISLQQPQAIIRS